MLIINNLATSDDYTDELTLESPYGGRLVYVVANQSAIMRQRRIPEDPHGAVEDYGQELVVTPQSSFVDRISGVKFRSAVAGSPARVIAQLAEPGDVLPASGTPFSGLLQASGGVGAGLGIYDVVTVPVDVESSAAESNLWQKTLAAVDWSNGRTAMRVQCGGDVLFNRNIADTVELRIRLGAAAPGTVIWDPGTENFGAVLSANRRGWSLSFVLSQVSLAAQRLTGLAVLQSAGTGLGVAGGSAYQPTQAAGTKSDLAYIFGSAAQPMGADSVFQLTAQWSVASALNSFRMNYLTADLLSL